MKTEYFSLTFTIVRNEVALVRLCNTKLEIEIKKRIKHDSYTTKIKRISRLNVIVLVCHTHKKICRNYSVIRAAVTKSVLLFEDAGKFYVFASFVERT